MLAAGAVLYWAVARRLPSAAGAAAARASARRRSRYPGLRALLFVTVLVGVMFGAACC